MRKSTQALMGGLSLASVITGVQLGASAKSTNFTASPVPTDTPSGSGTPTPTPTGTGTPTPTPTQTGTPTPTATQPQTSTITHTSMAVPYRYGVVQVTVTKTGGVITDIALDQAGATQGRGSAFPYLVSLALSAQSGSFDTSMMTGATYTANAFMDALNDALSQF